MAGLWGGREGVSVSDPQLGSVGEGAEKQELGCRRGLTLYS